MKRGYHTRAVVAVLGVSSFSLVVRETLFLSQQVAKTEPDRSASQLVVATPTTSCPPVQPRNKTAGSVVWVPGYPGSGSELFIDLLESATGFKAANVYVGSKVPEVLAAKVPKGTARVPECFEDNAITCKTHWPALRPPEHPWTLPSSRRTFASETVVLLRHPAEALPSYHNFKWEADDARSRGGKATEVGATHSRQAPIESWRTWRDSSFDKQLKNWAALCVQWMSPPSSDMTPYKPTVYVDFKDLVKEVTGPSLFASVLDVIAAAGHDVDSKDAACHWQHSVKEKPTKKRSKSYVPGFSKKQVRQMRDMLEQLVEKAVHDQPHLVKILAQYLVEMDDIEIDEDLTKK